MMSSLSGPGSGSGSVPGSGLRRGGGGEASDVADALLLEALQRPRPPPSIRQHGVRLQGQPGHLPAGKSAVPPLESEPGFTPFRYFNTTSAM